MTKAEFFVRDRRLLTGFSIRQHTDFAPEGEDIVCAAVSSAAYMTVNTIQEIMKAHADVCVDEDSALLRMTLKTDSVERCQELMSGFKLHVSALHEQYPKNIQVILTEV